MHHTPVVSVIVIFFNAEQFFEEAIQSVFDQQYRNWELLLVDDGSSDASTGLAVDLEKRYPGRVRHLEHAAHANRGMSASRNLGIQHARGEYIAFLDADDVWMPDKLSEQVSVLETYPQAGMTYGRGVIWSSWSDSAEAADYMVPLGVPAGSLIAPPNLLPNLVRNKVQTPMTSNAMLRRSVIQHVGGFEEEFTGFYEDQVFFSKVEMHTAVYVSGSCWVKYRQHAGSCSAVSARAGSYLSQRRPFLQWLGGYLDSLDIPAETPVRRALDRELWSCRHPHMNALLSPIVELIERTREFVANR
jgi:glycosyltransferase involved in cell wall biosynthesis